MSDAHLAAELTDETFVRMLDDFCLAMELTDKMFGSDV